jgi:hypothetical protein
MAGLMVGNLDD